MIAGRIIGSRLTRTIPSGRLLLGAVGIAALGFPVFWLGRPAAVSVAGLFVAGLGVANFYPLAMATAIGVAATMADKASARVSMGGGLAILAAPLMLGRVADLVGIRDAFGLVIVLVILAGGMALCALQFSARQAPALTQELS
jgi:MFS family permease